MADANLRKNAVSDARGAFYNLVLPFCVGIVIALFFAIFVPEMISLLHQKKTFALALHNSWEHTVGPYIAINDPNSKMGAEYFAWPFIGGIICTFMWRLYQDG